MPSQRQNQIRKGVWLACVGITIALSVAALANSSWVKGGGNEVGLSKMCTAGACSAVSISDLPPAWQATLVLAGFAVALMFITFILIIIVLKYSRDRLLFSSKVCCAGANLLLFIAMLVWPVGLGSEKFVPCDGGLAAESYHMCNPWDLGAGLYLMIIAMIFMTFAVCLSTLVTPKVSQRDTERLKRKRRETQGWYDPSRPRGKPSGEQSSTDETPAGGASGGSAGGKKGAAAAAGGAGGRLKPVKEEEQEEPDIGYLMIEAKGLSGWGEPESLQSGGARIQTNEMYGDTQGGDTQQSYFNPYFNDEEEFM